LIRFPLVGLPTLSIPPGPKPPRFGINQSYVRALSAAGCAPVMIPILDDEDRLRAIYERLDGIVFPGGADVAPQEYGEAPIDNLNIIEAPRDRTELMLARWAFADDLPTLGICRGQQVLNVALGGTLYQDIATQRPDTGSHRDESRYDAHFHEMRILADTWLARVYPGVSVKRVNTIHHQAVKNLGEGLLAEAVSEPDGLVEAMRWEGHSFVVGVQWHPEFMDPGDPSLIDSKPLLHAFLAACDLRKRTGKASPVMSIRAA
jgi:putative glutamine amidotransferase